MPTALKVPIALAVTQERVILSRVTVSAIGTWSARWAILACTSGTFTPSSLFCSSKLSSLVWQVMDLFFKLLVGRMHNGPIMAMLVLWAALRTLLGQVFFKSERRFPSSSIVMVTG